MTWNTHKRSFAKHVLSFHNKDLTVLSFDLSREFVNQFVVFSTFFYFFEQF